MAPDAVLFGWRCWPDTKWMPFPMRSGRKPDLAWRFAQGHGAFSPILRPAIFYPGLARTYSSSLRQDVIGKVSTILDSCCETHARRLFFGEPRKSSTLAMAPEARHRYAGLMTALRDRARLRPSCIRSSQRKPARMKSAQWKKRQRQ